MIEPTYLRMVRDRLGSGGLTPGSVADLPMGMVGLFEEALKSGSMQERQEWMRVLLVFAMLKEGMSVADMAALLKVDRQIVSDVVERFPSWFNSPEPGQFVLYHQRLSAFLLSVQAKSDVLMMSERLAELHGSSEASLQMYGWRHGLTHAVESVGLGGAGLDRLKALLLEDGEWKKRCDGLGSVEEMVDGLRAVADLAVQLQDAGLLTEAVRRTVWLGSVFNERIESALSEGEVPREELAAFLASRRSLDDRLHLLGLVTLKLDPEQDEDLMAPLWEQVSEELEEEYAEVQEFWPPWVLEELEERWGHLEPVANALEEVDAEAYEEAEEGTNPLLDKPVEFQFLSGVPDALAPWIESTLGMLNSPSSGPDVFAASLEDMPTGNLFLRDEVLVRITLKAWEDGVLDELMRVWLDWLLSESPFEVGPHAAGERPDTFDLFKRQLQGADRKAVEWMEARLDHWRFDRNARLKVQLMLSEWHHREGDRQKALQALVLFSSHDREDNRSSWMKHWIRGARSRRMRHFETFLEMGAGQSAAELLFEHAMDTGSESDFERAEAALEWADAVTRAEYLAEWALSVHDDDPARALDWLDRSWELTKDEDWAMSIVQLEVFSVALTVADEAWVNAHWKVVRKTLTPPYSWVEVREESNAETTLTTLGDDELIGPTVDEFFMDGVPEAEVKDERFSRGRNREILEASHPHILRFFKKQYPEAWEAAEERREYLAAFEERVPQLGSIREWWREFKPWFRSGGPGAADRWVWERILAQPHLFERFTAEDVRCLNVVTRKTWVRFPAERAIDLHPKVKQYLDRFHVDHWQMGTTWGFEGMGRYRSRLDREDMGDVLQGALESPWELAQDWTEEKHWNGAAFAFAECAHMREEMEQLLSWLELRAQLIELETT